MSPGSKGTHVPEMSHAATLSASDRLHDEVADYAIAASAIEGRKVPYEIHSVGNLSRLDNPDRPLHKITIWLDNNIAIGPVWRPNADSAFRAALEAFATWRRRREEEARLPELLEASVEYVRGQGVGNANGGES